jgi:hypothetical protein
MSDIYRFQDSCRMRRVIVAEAIGKRTTRQHEWRDSFRAILARIRHEPADRISGLQFVAVFLYGGFNLFEADVGRDSYYH